VISKIIYGELNAGVYSYNFNASTLSSGVYVYKLTAGEYSGSKIMSLIK